MALYDLSRRYGTGSAAASAAYPGAVRSGPLRQVLGCAEVVTRTDQWLGGPLVRFVYFQLLCQMALLVPAIGPLRLPVRIASYALSLFYLVQLRTTARRAPAAGAAAVVIAVVSAGLLHPDTNSLAAGLGQIGLYAAVIAPVFWVPRLRVSVVTLERVVLVIWAFHTLSALFGVLQVYFPGRFQPPLSTVIVGQGEGYVRSLLITLANGEAVLRPMGLTDAPGGAAAAGMYAVLGSIGILLASRTWYLKLVAPCSMALGFFCLYLCQVRSLLLMTVGATMAALALGARAGLGRRTATASMVLTVVTTTSLLWAVTVGGSSVTDRLQTLTSDDPGKVYYANRGFFLEATFTEVLPTYPLGAGLGRWGMSYTYLGDKSMNAGDSLWSEIMWTGWALDGGVPLIAAYASALTLSCWTLVLVFRRHRGSVLAGWGVFVAAYSAGAIALTFNANIFVSQLGMEFWLLNTALFVAASTTAGSVGRTQRLER